jgi:hypothetical protein
MGVMFGRRLCVLDWGVRWVSVGNGTCEKGVGGEARCMWMHMRVGSSRGG